MTILLDHDQYRRLTMMRNLPITWAALNIALASGLTWFVCQSEALGGTAILFGQ
jgi:hypothetical protein